MMDGAFRRILRPVDGRSKRGIYSRGRANYGGLLNASNPPKLAELARRRLMMRKNGNIANRTQRSS